MNSVNAIWTKSKTDKLLPGWIMLCTNDKKSSAAASKTKAMKLRHVSPKIEGMKSTRAELRINRKDAIWLRSRAKNTSSKCAMLRSSSNGPKKVKSRVKGKEPIHACPQADGILAILTKPCKKTGKFICENSMIKATKSK